MTQDDERLPESTEPAPSSDMPWRRADGGKKRSSLDGIVDLDVTALKGGDPHRFATALESDPEAAQMLDQVRSLSTAEGRAAAMRELGVHVKGRVGESVGVSDDEADRLLSDAAALRTREGRESLMRQYGTGTKTLADVERDNMAPLDERRNQTAELVASGPRGFRRDTSDRGAIVGVFFALIALGGVAIVGGLILGALAGS